MGRGRVQITGGVERGTAAGMAAVAAISVPSANHWRSGALLRVSQRVPLPLLCLVAVEYAKHRPEPHMCVALQIVLQWAAVALPGCRQQPLHAPQAAAPLTCLHTIPPAALVLQHALPAAQGLRNRGTGGCADGAVATLCHSSSQSQTRNRKCTHKQKCRTAADIGPQ